MKIKLLPLILIAYFLKPAISAPVQSALPAPNNDLFYIAPEINARIDSSHLEWKNQLPIILNSSNQAKYAQGDWRGPSDCSAKIWIGWNNDGLVIAAQTIDDSVAFPMIGNDLWSNDCLQFAVDIHDDNDPNYYQSDDREFVLTIADSQAIVYEYTYTENRNSGPRDYPVQVVVSHDTIRYEALIPWNGLGLIGPFASMHFGFSVVVFDNDGQNCRGWLEWTSGITRKKFTLPFGNLLLFDPDANIVQAIPTQPFLSETDSLSIWIYSKTLQSRLSYRLFEDDETFFRNTIRMSSQKWIKLTIPSKYLKWGRLKLEINSFRITQMFDILIWSKQLILEQIGYLSQQVEIFKNLKSIDPSACFMVEYWVEWLQHELAACSTNFDFYNLMIQAQKRIDQIPNFYLKKQVYYNREQRIVESLYKSEREQRIRRYLLHLPTDFTKEKTYPAFVFVHDVRNNEEESARKIGNLLAKYDLPIIGVFPKGYPDLGTTYFGLEEIMNCIADVCSKYSIDKNRIYLTGEGSAGFEVLQLAQNYPDKFAALTVAFCKLNDNFRLQNLALTPMWFFYEQNQQDEYLSFAEKINRFQGSIRLTNLTSDTSREDYLFSLPYFRWLLQQRKAVPTKIYLHIKHLKPSAAFWVKPLAQNDYNEAALLEATLDSNNIFLATKNLPALAVTLSKLPPTAVYPLTVFFDNHQQLKIEDKKIDEIIFKREGQKWNILKQAPQYLEKIPAVCGPLAAIFDKPIKFIYSTLDIDNKYNQLCYQLTKQSSQRGRDEFLNQLLIADTVQAKQKIEANVITFGNEASNAYLKKIVAKLPLRIQQNGIRFGRSFCDAPGCAAIYIFPNPENPNYLILVGTAPDTSGLKNIARLWEPFFSNVIFDYDYILFGDGVVRNSYTNWIDYGTFDHYWSLPWFQPLFTKGPKFWHNDISAGLDANQLSLNRNWKGGGKGNFTWKIYAKMEFLYAKEKFNWKNSLYCAFGQISVQENENWLAPEKSTDIIDFDSVLKLTLKKFIDPYLAFSMDTQFHDGYNPRSKILTSRFINPLILSQSSGFARNVTTKKILETTTRVGYAAKEVIVTARQFRALWTGDEARGYKMDGGFEWLTESKSEFAKGIILTNKLKLFQAIFSSISPDKDPHKNWQKTDLYWEQMFTAQLTQYILFNVIAKFIYDRDTSVGGQFLENASFGLSYKF